MHDLEGRQLSFDWQIVDQPESENTLHEIKSNIVTFVDARTQARRRMAMERVKTAGIFSVPIPTKIQA
ncbi:hypothetical protein NKW55_14355 [Gluconobacter kondonii]|uniref:hypothetical protein n=1 Tax=Gluconobacter kondonii TaxID=941463 RepID=UPI0020A1864B|nr:hypothetical protein [Gluconobacter kondonii]MCP1237758.1 hypothetical protein [Gluconobacter kondonii]